jgi:hypothetical protein
MRPWKNYKLRIQEKKNEDITYEEVISTAYLNVSESTASLSFRLLYIYVLYLLELLEQINELFSIIIGLKIISIWRDKK